MKSLLAIAGWIWAGGIFLSAGELLAAAPVLSNSGPGRFEIASLDAGAATLVRTEAENAWRILAEPLGLPSGFSTPIFVRVVPAADWAETVPFRVFAEAGGVVSLRLRWSELAPRYFLRRALVQALLMRLAVAEHGVGPNLTAPLWLEHAAVGWWLTRAEPARFDALQAESVELAPPRLADVLGWTRSDVEPRSLAVGAVWLLTWLQHESGAAREWPELRRRLLRGDEPLAALAGCFPGRFDDAAEKELWWQTGWHAVRRVRTLPMMGSTESRLFLTDLARVVVAVGGDDVVVPLRFALRQTHEPAVAALLAVKALELERVLPALHLFYRNAGVSLAECLSPGKEPASDGDERAAAYERDWALGFELENRSREILNAAERARQVRSASPE